MKEMAREKARPEVLKLFEIQLDKQDLCLRLRWVLRFYAWELYDNTSVIDEFDLVFSKKGFILNTQFRDTALRENLMISLRWFMFLKKLKFGIVS